MPNIKKQSLLLMLTLLTTLTLAATIVQADGPGNISPPAKKEIKYPNLGSQLSQLAVDVEDGTITPEQAAQTLPIHSQDSGAVTIHLSDSVDQVVQFLEDNGGDPRNTGEDYIEAYVPMTLLGELSQQPGVIRVRDIIPPQPSTGPPAGTQNPAPPAISSYTTFQEFILKLIRALAAAALQAQLETDHT